MSLKQWEGHCYEKDAVLITIKTIIHLHKLVDIIKWLIRKQKKSVSSLLPKPKYVI